MIIHNPDITGSLGFPRTDGTKVVIKLSSNGGLETIILDASGSETGQIPASNFSGSFTGSFVGDGSLLTGVAASELNIDLFNAGTIAADDELLFSDTDDSGSEKRGTFKSGLDSVGVISASAQLYTDLDSRYGNELGDGIVSSSEQISSYNTFLEINGMDVVSGSNQVVFNNIHENPFSSSATQVTVEKHIVPSNLNIDLGNPTTPFRDLYLSSASLYIDGTRVMSSDTTELIITTDTNQSLKLVETGADTVQIQTENGDITLTSSGTGNIELDAPIQIVAGNQILSSDGNAIQFGEDLDIDGDLNVQGNITLTGTVDGIDLQVFSGSVADTFAGLSTDYNDLINIPVGIVSGSSQVVLEDADKTGFTGASSITTLGTISTGVWQGSIIDSQYLDADPLPAGTISGSAQVDLTQTTNYVSGIKTRLNAEGVISGSSQVTGYVPTNSAQALSSDDNALTFAANTLTLTRGDGTTDTVDLSNYLDDTNLARVISGTYNSGTQELVFTRDDATTFSIDASMFLDDTNLVTAVNTKTGDVTLVTDDIAEDGSPTNLWFTTARARGAFSAGTGVSISSGEISIGQAVATNSNVQFAKVGVGGATDATYELKVTGDIGATGDVVAYVSSDERLKKNIELISNPIQKVQALKGVTWVWKDEASDAAKASPNVGVIAQDVEKVLPQLVHDRENGYKGVDYGKMVGLLIEAIKDQQKQIDDLKSRLQ